MIKTAPALDPKALFNVTSVAVVGASPGKHYSGSVLHNLVEFGISADRVWPVNPKYDDIDGLKAYKSLADLPETPSMVFSLVGVKLVNSVLDDVIANGIPAMVTIADGYSEMGEEGEARQAELAAKAREHGVVVLGPNSLGYIAPSHGIGAWVGGRLSKRLTAGNVSLAFQSSGMLNLVMNQVSQRKIGVSAAISVGNEAVMDVADYIRLFADDPETEVLGIALESTTRPRALAEAMLYAHQAGKTVVVLSFGKSERGMKNVASHAGRMATSGKVWNALFRQVGALVVDHMTDFMETIALASALPRQARGGGIALATISGGDCGLLCDMAERVGLELADVTPATQTFLDAALERTNILANPLDVRNTRTSNPPVFWDSLAALAADPNIATVALRLNLAAAPNQGHIDMYREVTAQIRASGAEVVFMSRVTETASEAWFDLFHELGAPFLTSYDGALKAFANLQHHRASERFVNATGDFAALPEVVGDLPDSEPLAWAPMMAWVAEHGIPFTRTTQAPSVEAAVEAAAGFAYPLVAKGIVPGVAHKSDLGLVELRIEDADDLRARAASLFDRMSRIEVAPGSDPVGVEIQEMASGGTEFFIGMHTDPILGRILSFGLGGIFLEILHDVVNAIPPISAAQAAALLRTLGGWELLAGARGQQPRDVAALADTIARVSEAVAGSDVVTSFDLNPVLVMAEGDGVLAVDAYVEAVTPSTTT
jgi:acyl-CoA synthetase (NDP forming)